MKNDYVRAYGKLRKSYLVIFLLSTILAFGFLWGGLKFLSGDNEPIITTIVAVITGIVTSLFYDNIIRVIKDGNEFVEVIDKKILILNDIKVNVSKIKETINFIINSNSDESGILLLFNSIQECKVNFTRDELFDSISLKAIISLFDVFSEKLQKMKNKKDIAKNKDEFFTVLGSLDSVIVENISTLSKEKEKFLAEKERLDKALDSERD